MGRIFHKVEKFWEFGGGRMVMAAICAHSVGISIGITQGYSAIWLPQLNETQNEFNISTEQSSWLASFGAVTNPIGSVLSGILAEALGRKRSIQISSLPFIVGWILIAFGRNISWLYSGRLITGIAGGMSTASFTYVGEIATPNSRGFLQTLSPIFASFGILLTYVLGYLISWRIIALISISFAIFTVFTMQFLPDSPPYLVKSGKESLNPNSDAFKAYVFFTGNVAAAEQEIQKATANATDENNESIQKSLKQLYLSPETVKPFLILVFLFLLQELSGIYTILYYAVQFIGETHLKLNDYVASIIVGTIRFVMSLVCAMLIQKVGRKTLCTYSSCGMALSVLALGLYINYYEINPDKTRILTLLPLVCIVFNVFFSMMGMLPIPWVLVGEMFPLRVRPIMAGIVICMAQCFIFVCVKMYNTMVEYMGFSGTIYSFFAASACAMLYSKYVLPETKGKTLDEIENLFKKNDRVNNPRSTEGVTNEGYTGSSENITVVTR